MNPRLLRELGDVLAELRSRPSRTVVAIGALTLGVAAIAGVLAVHAGLERRAEAAIRGLGEGVVAITNAAPRTRATVHGLTLGHVAILKTSFPEARFTTTRRYPAPTDGPIGDLTVVETDTRFDEVRRWRLTDGRFLDHRDLGARARVAVPIHALAERMGLRVGDRMMIGSLPFEVIGVIEPGFPLPEAGDPAMHVVVESTVFVPVTTAPRWHIEGAYADDRVDAVFASMPPGEEVPTLEAIVAILGDPALAVGPVIATTAETLTRGIRELQFTIAIAGGGASILVLLLGGAMLTAMTVADVQARTAEIGMRRAIGAERADIARLFMLETGLIAALAGIISTLVALPVIATVAKAVGLPFETGPWVLVAPVGMAVIVGLAASAWPASRAASLEPSAAMRGGL